MFSGKLTLKWFLLPAALIAVGAVLLALAVSGIAGSATAQRHPLNPGGVTTLALTDKGRYEVYYEYQGAPALQQNIVFTFENRDSGRVTQSSFPTGKSYYHLGDTRGEMIAFVNLDPGTYDISSNYRPDGVEPVFLLTSGSGGRSIVSSAFQLGGGIFCIVAGGIVLAIFLVLRHNPRRRGNGYDAY